MDTIFEQWLQGRVGNFGSFQTTIFEAYKLADSDNQKKLASIYPHWFQSEDKINGAFKTMQARFNSKCAETGVRLNKGDNILYNSVEKKAYALDSDTARRYFATADGAKSGAAYRRFGYAETMG